MKMGNRSYGKGNIFQLTVRRGNLAEIEELLLAAMVEKKLKKAERKKARQEMLAQGKGSLEFIGCVKASAALNRALVGGVKDFMDKKFLSRTTKVHSVMVKEGDGAAGRRAIRVQQNAHFYHELTLDARSKLDGRLLNFPRMLVNAERNTVTAEFEEFNPAEAILGPGSARHFRLALAVAVVSDFSYRGGEAVYESEHPELGELCAVSDTGFLSLYESVPAKTLVASLPGLPVLPDGTLLLVFLGIEFALEINGCVQSMVSGRAMQVVAAY